MARTRRDRDDAGLRATIGRVIELHHGQVRISPHWVATEAMVLLDGERISPKLVYLGCHLQLRQIAREILRGKYAPDEEDDAWKQDELWPDLQQRYPAARSADKDDPEYILRDQMSEADVRYNVARLRGEAGAKLRHADALEAWWQGRPWRPAAA